MPKNGIHTTFFISLLALGLVCLLTLDMKGQASQLDSLEKSISKSLTARNYFQSYYGLPPIHQGNTEVVGNTELDRRLFFFEDHTFEEWVLKDWDVPVFPEKCVKTNGKTNFTLLFSGEWKLMGNNVLLKYKFELVYSQADFSNCLTAGQPKRFKCSSTPICNFDLSLKRMFLFKKEELHEVGNLEYNYK
jgi:hypothetical protein